jgi:hypothetical protein
MKLRFEEVIFMEILEINSFEKTISDFTKTIFGRFLSPIVLFIVLFKK